MNRLHMKKRALMAALMQKGYLRTVTGNPAILTNALKKPLQGVTVYGASGGVGDATINLFDKADINVVHGYLTYNSDSSSAPGVKYIASSTATDTIYIPCKPNTTYTAHKGAYLGGSIFRFGSSTHIPDARQYNRGEAGDITDYTAGVMSDEVITYTTGASDVYLFLSVSGWLLGDTELTDVLMIVEGEYTAETMPEYEPYGYKIPVRFGDLPAGYTQLKYIESTGTQYIDTGIVPTDTQAFDITYAWTALPASGAYAAVFSTYINEQTNATRILQYNNNITYANVNAKGGGGTVSFSGVRSTGIIYHDVLRKNNAVTLYSTNETEGTNANTQKGTDNTNNIPIFAQRNANGMSLFSKIKLYSFAITDNDTLIRNFIPAKRNSDGEIGMYDTVTGTFFTNSGTGDFIAGAEVPLNKTINLFAPQQLTAAADTFAADIAAQTATLTAGGVSTDVSAMQDWEQDWTLNKGDNTVSIGTTVQPSAVEWRYLSSSRG